MMTLGTLMGAQKGQFVLFLGGADLGKSLMLRKLASRLPSRQRRYVKKVVAASRKPGSSQSSTPNSSSPTY